MALSITFSLGVALVVSLTLIPMLSSLRPPNSGGEGLAKFRFVRIAAVTEAKIEKRYEKRLSGILDRPTGLFVAIAALFAFTVFLGRFVRSKVRSLLLDQHDLRALVAGT